MKGILLHGLHNYRGKLYWILGNRVCVLDRYVETNSEEEKLKVVGLLVAVSRFGRRYQGLKVGTNVYRRTFRREKNKGRHQCLEMRNMSLHKS
jgi:hypothetical protein